MNLHVIFHFASENARETLTLLRRQSLDGLHHVIITRLRSAPADSFKETDLYGYG